MDQNNFNPTNEKNTDALSDTLNPVFLSDHQNPEEVLEVSSSTDKPIESSLYMQEIHENHGNHHQTFSTGSFTYSQENFNNINNFFNDFESSKEPKKKNRRKKTNTGLIVTITLICCIVSAALFGAGGFLLASHLSPQSAPPEEDSFPVIGNQSEDTAKTPNDTTPRPDLEVTFSDTTENTETSLTNAIANCINSVVSITTESQVTNSFYGNYVEEGAGSGVIIDTSGYIITCAHVVDGATNIIVTLENGEEYIATLIGSDSQTDIAVIKIEAENLVAAKIGSSASLVLGEGVIAIGNPLGSLGGTVTNGIISALERQVEIEGQSYTLLQTNAAINPGNSGGGLFNDNGVLIGIVNAKSSGTGIEGLGFAIPIDSAIQIAQELADNGYISGRPALGVYIYEVNSQTSASTIRSSDFPELINYINAYGVYFIRYTSNQTGELQFGDRIVAINSNEISTFDDISSLLSEYTIGDTLTLTISRLDERNRSKMHDITITLIEKVPE